MSGTAGLVLHNSIVRVGGYALGAALYFAVVVIIARHLGAEGFGRFTVIFAFVSVFQLLVDMGVRNILIREIAVDRTSFAKHLGVARFVMWILSGVGLSLMALAASLAPVSGEVRLSVYIAGLAVIVTFHGLCYSAVLRAFEEMGWDIIGFVLHKVILMGFIGLAVRAHGGLAGVFAAFLAANACQYFYYRILVGYRHGRAALRVDPRGGWAMLAESFPLGVAEILRRLTWQADKLLLAALAAPVAVGVFSAANKILEAMNPFTVNLTLPLFPVFSRLARDSSVKLSKAYEQSLKFLYVMGVPIATALFVLADSIALLLFGEAFRESGEVLRVLAPAVILLLPTSVYGYLFTAMGRQRLFTVCVAISLSVNLVVDLALIPFYGALGAAVGTVAGESALFLSGLIVLRQVWGGWLGLGVIGRPLLAGLAMGVVCWWLKSGPWPSVAVGLMGGLAVYTMVLLAANTFTRQELALLADAMKVRLGSAVR